MSTEIVIEKDIPIPPRTMPGKWKDVVTSMAIGDSFLCTRLEAACVYHAARSLGVKIETRTTNRGVRVWRMS